MHTFYNANMAIIRLNRPEEFERVFKLEYYSEPQWGSHRSARHHQTELSVLTLRPEVSAWFYKSGLGGPIQGNYNWTWTCRFTGEFHTHCDFTFNDPKYASLFKLSWT